MNARQSKRALDIVSGALERDPEARQAFVEAECADDSAVRGEVDRLFALSKEGEGIGFLEQAPQLTVKAVVTDPLIGRCVGPYKILEVLGEGGMGVVYLAEQTEPIRRRVALKLIKPGMDTARVVSRFETERQALATMDHPGVAKVFDASSTEQGRPYFVMEYVEGTRITDYCDQNRLSTPERLKLFTQVCRAVQHAHQKGIIHRDIKPSNVLVTVQDETPVPKVIDFGVAKATQQTLTEETAATEQGSLIGTPEYMSPEQSDLTAADIDTRADIYSLGVLLYELLVGALPFEPKSLRRAALGEVQRIIREEDPPKPSTRLSSLGDESGAVARKRRTDRSSLERQIRGDLDWVTMKAMERDRTRRYSAASEFADDIARHLAHEPVLASPPTVAYRARKFIRRNRLLVLSVVIVTAAVLAGTTVSVWQAVRATRAERVAGEERDRARRELAKKEAVVDYMLRMIGAGNPLQDGNKRVTLHDAIERSERWIDSVFRDDPGTKASVRSAIGSSYMVLGDYDRANTQLTAALDLTRQVFSDRDVEVATALDQLGQLRDAEGRYEEAEQLLRSAVDIRREQLGDAHPSVAETLRNLAQALMTTPPRLDEAKRLCREALAIHEAQPDQNAERVAETLGTLAAICYYQHDYQEAAEHYRRARTLAQTNLGDDHPTTMTITASLAAVLQALNQFDEAETMLLASLKRKRGILGADHPETAFDLDNLGRLCQSKGDYERALELHQQALDIRREKLGGQNPTTGMSAYNLAHVYARLNRHAEAAQLFRQACEIYERHYGENAAETALCLHNLGFTLSKSGANSEAEPALREALRLRRTKYGHASWEALLTLERLASTLYALAEYDESADLFTEYVEGVRSIHGPTHGFTRTAMLNRGRALKKAGRLDEAAKQLAALVEMNKESQDGRLPDSMIEYGEILMLKGDVAKADGTLQEAINVGREAWSDGRWELAHAVSLRGQCLTVLERFDDAEPLLLAAYKQLAASPETPKDLVDGALERIVTLYEAWGNPAKAAEWRTKSISPHPR